MNDGLFSTHQESALYLSRLDPEQSFSSVSDHAFLLEGKHWPTVEHYYQAMKFDHEDHQEKIRLSEGVEQARKLGASRLKKRRQDWKRIKVTMMTRAVYTKFKTYPELAKQLLATEGSIVESSQYDYFWGCGRDKRGHNHYGQVLMNVRNKLLEEQQ